MTSVTISTIRNSCIVNNANIAVQNINNTPLDAINNWWGMPTGATHDNIPSGDAVGERVLHAPHLPTMPFLCDLTNADWIPFSEQELQNAINSHIPYLGGIAFALIDLEWGRGAKFDILTHPNYGNRHDVAYIRIQPNPTGDLITFQLDLTRLPTDEMVRQIVTCELVPLFVNSLQQVQNRYVSPSQNIASMVVMERDLMMRFSPPTEITPEPTPELVLNYDASCLPNVTPPETIIESGNGESLNLVTIPPLEGEFTLLTEDNEGGESEPVFEIEERLLFHVAYPYPSQNRGIYSADPITGEVYNLLDILNIVGEVALSPNGDYIVFTGFVAGDFNNFGMFIMRSDGSELRSLGNLATNYRHIGWTHENDNQWVTFSVGTEEITYAMQPTQNIADAIVVIPDGIRPKWIGMGVNKVIYTSDNHLFIAEFNPSTFEIVTIPEQITPVNSPTGVGNYEWSDNGNDVIFEENNQLWRYRDGWATLINQTNNGEIIGSREFMTRPNTNHIATVLGHSEVGYDGALYHLDNIQRIRLSAYTIQFANPLHFINNTPTDWHNWGNNRNLHRPFLSPYRNGNTIEQDLYFVECGQLVPTNCYYSYILDANTLIPRAIFQNTPVAGVPAIAWQDFRLPVITNNEPTEIVCIAPSTVRREGFRVRSTPTTVDENGYPTTDNVIFNVPPETNVGVIYIYEYKNTSEVKERWYRVRYDSDNDTTLDALGWMGGDPFSNFGDCDRIPVLDENYNPIPLATYDYPLPPPPAEEDWLNRECLDGVPQPPGMSDSEHYDLQVDNWRECSKIVYFVYYNIMFHLYESEPLLSDVLTSIYGTELSLYYHEPRKSIMGLHGASGKNAYELSIEALGVNYWISCDLENCHPSIGSPITSETARKLVNQYLYSINAWYADALALREWYNQFDFEMINSAQDMRDQVNILEALARSTTLTPEQRLNLRGFRAFLALIPDNRYQPIGIQSLDAVVVYREDRSPRQWGNHGYNREGYIQIYTEYNNLETGFKHDKRIVLCIKNTKWIDNDDGEANPEDEWSDDIFVMVTVRSLYPTSFYNLAISGIPDWSTIEPVPYRGSQSVSCDTALNLEKKEQ